MGQSLSEVQLPVGVSERMRQHCGRHAEPNHYSPQPRGHVIHPRWSSPRCHSQAEGYDPAVVEGNHGIEKEVCATAGQVLVEMHVTDWAKTQREDPVLNAVLDWLEVWKKTDLKTLLGEHASSEGGWLVWRNHQNFKIHQKTHYLCTTPKGKSEDLLLFVVPREHWVTALSGCHWDAGHQDHEHTLSLLQEHFWWPGMTNQMQQSIRTCTHCLQHKGCLPKALLHPIMATVPLDLLHIDFTSIETTLEPNQSPRVANVLVFQDHFTKHVLAYVTPTKLQKTSLNFYIRVTSPSLGPWPGSWVTEVLISWAVWLRKCARSLV